MRMEDHGQRVQKGDWDDRAGRRAAAARGTEMKCPGRCMEGRGLEEEVASSPQVVKKGVALLGDDHRVDYMNDPVGGQDVGLDDVGGVNLHTVTGGNLQGLTLHGRQ